MGDIIENVVVDQDTVGPEVLYHQFDKKYKLVAETAVSLSKATYINKLHGTRAPPGGNKCCFRTLRIAVSLTDNSLEVYQLNNTSLQKVCRLSGHKNSNLTEVVFCPKGDHLLFTTGHDGVVKLWDTRCSGKCAMEYKDEDDPLIRPYECMDVSCTGTVLCAGSQLVQDDAYLVFWDHRQPKPLGGYWNSHTDDITAVRFHKDKTQILATGAVDGLVNIFDIMETNEDDALTYSLNVENSVEKLTWLDNKKIASITQSSDIQIWDTTDGEMLEEYSRFKVAKGIRRSREDDCYLVDAFSTSDNKHILLAGSYAGNGDVLRSVSMSNSRLSPSSNFEDNKQIVRSCWYDKDRDLLVTTGESGLISVWADSDEENVINSSHKIATSFNKLHLNRHKPY